MGFFIFVIIIKNGIILEYIRMIVCNILFFVGMCFCVYVRGSRCYGWLLVLVIEWKFGKEVLDCINK